MKMIMMTIKIKMLSIKSRIMMDGKSTSRQMQGQPHMRAQQANGGQWQTKHHMMILVLEM